MAEILHPLLLLVARATDLELARYVEYLKAENRILRSKLPKRVHVTLSERKRLVELGLRVGPAIRELISVVTPRTFARWVAGLPPGHGRRKPGRPRKPEEVRQLILRIAEDTTWGSKRILGELRKLGIRDISRATVARILKEKGVEPGPRRGNGTWHDFVERHMTTLWACDFFSTKVWTLHGLVKYYVLFFIHVESRRVHIAGITANPDASWMKRQAEELSLFFDGQGDSCPTHIVRDRDSKFTTQFCKIIESRGIEFRPIPPRSPNMNPFAETWVGTIKRECLNHFMIMGEKHLRYLVSEFVDHFHKERPHQGLGNRPPDQTIEPEPLECLGPSEVVCYERLGGVLRHFQRKAA